MTGSSTLDYFSPSIDFLRLISRARISLQGLVKGRCWTIQQRPTFMHLFELPRLVRLTTWFQTQRSAMLELTSDIGIRSCSQMNIYWTTWISVAIFRLSFDNRWYWRSSSKGCQASKGKSHPSAACELFYGDDVPGVPFSTWFLSQESKNSISFLNLTCQ